MAVKKENAPEPVTAFVRFLIERHRAANGQLTEIVERGGFASAPGKKSSMVSQVQKTSLVTNITGPKFAKAFGYADYPELVQVAYAWARSADKSVLPRSNAALTEAIDLAFRYGITQAQVDRAIASVGSERLEHLDAPEWLALFHFQRSTDARLDGELLAEGRAAASREAAKKRYQADVEATRKKKSEPAPRARAKAAG